MTAWHHLTATQSLEQGNSHPTDGLSKEEVARRLEQHGPNELVERGTKSPWMILLDQLKETMVVILVIAAVISALLGDLKDAIAIVAIVIINAVLGFRQEYQAEQAMAALKKLAVPTVRVRRDGHLLEISARQLVPGDIIYLEAGNTVPADARVLESVNLRVQEAALTGESEPVTKIAEALDDSDLPLTERHNMLYMGTTVTYGRGHAMVTDTGMNTELGAIAEMIQATGQEKTPLQRRLDQLGKGLALAALILVGIVFVLGLLRGEDLKTLFLTSISIAVAAVPEGLPAVVTIALALGARRMLRRRSLIRKLPAVETLGSVTVICSDKTGTLTENRMTVTILDLANHRIDLTEEEHDLPLNAKETPCQPASLAQEQANSLQAYPALALQLAGGALCNDAVLECEEGDPDFHIVGDPTEGALVVAAARMGLVKEALETISPRVGEVPFDSERKRMTTIHRINPTTEPFPAAFRQILDVLAGDQPQPYIAFTKGSPDGLLGISDRVWVSDHVEPLDAGWRQRIEASNSQLAQEGMRVLGLGCRLFSGDPATAGENIEQDLVFIGLFGMIDPARPEVKAAVQTCRDAGIRPVMITGDHPLTARYIARELGILPEGQVDSAQVVTGQELGEFDDERLKEVVAHTSVFARVSPEHKLRIVQALQSNGQIAAMTGDGVNDAPALRRADIGVAMGITGTDVSKEASDMVLLDDNFATIVAAVEEGRTIYENIRKFIQYTLSSNTGEIWTMLLAPFLNMPLPLVPLQILWINLVTDGLPGLALGVEKSEPDTMRRPPHPPNENIFARRLGTNVLWVGFLMGVVSLGIGYLYWRNDNPLWQTMVFTTLTLSEMGYVMAIRSSRYSLFTIGLLSNKPLLGAVILTILLQMAVTYVPFLNSLFHTLPLPPADLAICLLLATTLFWAVEIQKFFIRRQEKMSIEPLPSAS